jgi:SAM-dependent methyltransferase
LEIEIELAEHQVPARQAMSELDKLVTDLWLEMRDSRLPYTLAERQAVEQALTNLLQPVLPAGMRLDNRAPRLATFSRGWLPVLRSLKQADLVVGGLVPYPRAEGAGSAVPGHCTYHVAHKADGLRRLAVLYRGQVWLIFPPFDFQLLRRDAAETKLTVLEGEWLPESQGGRLLVFDALAMNGVSLVQKWHRQRVSQAQNNWQRDPSLPVIFKAFKVLSTTAVFFERVRSLLHNRPDYPTDGLVFIAGTAPYLLTGNALVHGAAQEVLVGNIPVSQRDCTKYLDLIKWKPQERLTLDFELHLAPLALGAVQSPDTSQASSTAILPTLSAVAPYQLLVDKQIYWPVVRHIQYENPQVLALPEGSIVEYGWDAQQELLVFHKTREDKPTSNRWDVIEDNWHSIHYPITGEDLEGTGLGLVRWLTNRLKAKLLALPFPVSAASSAVGSAASSAASSAGPTLLDLGSGQGGDLHKWQRGDFRQIFAVEPLAKNREEFRRRLVDSGWSRLTSAEQGEEVPLVFEKTRRGSSEVQRLTLLPYHAQDTDQIGAALAGRQVDVVSLMLSLTFFYESAATLQALVRTIRHFLTPQGVIVFYTLDGDKVEALFEPVSGVHSTEMILAGASMTLSPAADGSRRLDVSIDRDIVGQQTEWLVRLPWLVEELNRADGLPVAEDVYTDLEPGWRILYQPTVSEPFLSADQLTYHSLFTGGIIIRGQMDDQYVALPALPDCVAVEGIRDNHSLLHAVLKALSTDYQNAPAQTRRDLAVKCRGCLAGYVQGNSQAWWEMGAALYPRLVLKRLYHPEQLGDFTQAGVVAQLLAGQPMDQNWWGLITYALQITLFVLTPDGQNQWRVAGPEQSSVLILLYQNGIYQLVVRRLAAANLGAPVTSQTIFPSTDSLVVALLPKLQQVVPFTQGLDADEQVAAALGTESGVKTSEEATELVRQLIEQASNYFQLGANDPMVDHLRRAYQL